MRLLLTRPEHDAERTAQALRSRGHEVVLLPLMRIEPLTECEIGPGPWGAVVVTSANACRAIAAHPSAPQLRALPLFAVGRRTAQAAQAAGFLSVVSADGALAELANLIIGVMTDRTRPLLHLAGADRAGDLRSELATAGLKVETAVIYRAVLEPRLAPPIAASLSAGEIDGVLHFSARSARAFLDAVAAAGLSFRTLKVQHYCLSAQVAAPLAAAGAQNLRIADHANESALVDLPGR